jgi:hypothetical protein
VTVAKATPPTPSAGQYTYPVKLGSVTHTFAKACLYPVTTTVTDDDTLSAVPVTTSVIVTAPLGSEPAGPGYWQQQLSPPPPPSPPGGRLPAATLACYLAIAQHLSPGLGPNLTPASALAILKAPDPGPTKTAKLAVQVRQELLTVLLDFANGGWNWTAAVGQNRVTFETVVWNANQALLSRTAKSLQTAINTLHQTQGFEPPPNLVWAPGVNGIYSFGTLKAGTAGSRTFTITNPGPDGKPHPLPPAMTVALIGPSATEFKITANTCPGSAPPPAPPLTSCQVTVQFKPAVTDMPYSETLTVFPGPAPPKGPIPPNVASLTLTGTGS